MASSRGPGRRPVRVRTMNVIRSARLEPPSVRARWARRPRGLDELGVVQEHQGLERRGGRLPLHGADLAGGGVERQHGRRRRGPLPERIEAAAVAPRARRRAGRSVPTSPPTGPAADTASPAARRSCRPAARRRQGTVADHLGRQPEPRPAGQQHVLRVLGQQVGRRIGALPVGRRGHDQPHQSLDVPARVDERPRQPVEQLGVARGAGPGCRSPRAWPRSRGRRMTATNG